MTKAPIARDLAQLGKFVALHHGWAAAKAFKSSTLSPADGEAVAKAGFDLQRIFPATPDEAPLISAALAVRLEDALSAPAYVVAGTLAVEGVPVLGNRLAFDPAAAFAGETPAFNGHVWLMVGDIIIDIALFRLAYSAQGPATLSRHVDLAFGPGKALFVDRWKHAARLGLNYEPHYVLSSDEVTRLMGGAFHAIKAAQG
ncbi:hypothetical protein [Novosphingobium terrae]|uniref:hypothetical protein n=1 Tax=Novosphingobium terrae TaxID=2726189 RepID=UPI00197E0553|nr:hypothetical protein [Novosphingobium terrae]